MAKAEDEADRARKGTQKQDPFEGSEPMVDTPPTAGGGDGDEQPHFLAGLWKPIDPALVANPPRRDWLLTRIDDATNAERGVIPRGKSCCLAAPGGTGKTTAICQLALAVAANSAWFEWPTHPRSGRVLMLLGEEDEGEVARKMRTASESMVLGRDRLATALGKIVAIPLAGVAENVALATGQSGQINRSALGQQVDDMLHKDGEWDLVIIDPMSRFSDAETEKDNYAATRFVQIIEGFTKAPGNPTVLVTAHSSQQSTREGKPGVRGVTGLVDGFRFVMGMAPMRAGKWSGATLSWIKSNYSPRFPDTTLLFDEGGYGAALRKATKAEAAEIDAAVKDQEEEEKQARAEATKRFRARRVKGSEATNPPAGNGTDTKNKVPNTIDKL